MRMICLLHARKRHEHEHRYTRGVYPRQLEFLFSAHFAVPGAYNRTGHARQNSFAHSLYSPRLHKRQKHVLLRATKALHFINKQHRPLARQLKSTSRFIKYAPYVLRACGSCGKLDEAVWWGGGCGCGCGCRCADGRRGRIAGR